MNRLSLDPSLRKELWQRLAEVIENYTIHVDEARVTPELDPEKLRSLLKPFDFKHPHDPIEAINFVVDGLWQHQVHVSHRRYFGLFNPAPTTMAIVADALAAAFNPQLAAWSHSPFAVEIEQQLVRAFAERFGYDPKNSAGTFASGGAEANHTGLLAALVHSFPNFARAGLRGIDAQPVFYVSSQSHHSFMKAARLCGLGTDAVREIPINDDWQMDVRILESQIAKDRRDGFAPFLIVATAGTTNAGVVDPIPSLADIAKQETLWLHVDAAWGGAAVLVAELRDALAGIECADSITFDAHKWLSVPMAAGLFLTRHREILNKTFRITADYMPREAAGMDVIDPYIHSMQWSRRFIGLKVFLSLAVAGWKGYEEAIRHQAEMGDLLRKKLEAADWRVVNKTRLPAVCFVDAKSPRGRTVSYIEALTRAVLASGEAWISSIRINHDTAALRACITNFRTTSQDLDVLVQTLNQARLSSQG
jgi:glutamate/tyrosine decarboxylase-like PLP-dependent enzyme